MPTPEEWRLTCPYCSSSPTPFGPAHQLATQGGDGGQRNWQTATCPSCGGMIVAELDASDGHIRAIYPHAVQDWAVAHLPETVEPNWSEAISVFRVGALHATVVLCGRTLEAAADARGIGSGTLQRRLAEMLEQGLITVEFKEAMDYSRMIRNVGAHAGKHVTRESAEGAMRFTQQALRLLFEVPAELALLTGPTEDELTES